MELIFDDTVHGFYEFPSSVIKFVDTPHFQRLRDLKQLGVCCYAFTGATHTRFEHSPGTAYLARKQLGFKKKSTRTENQ